MLSSTENQLVYRWVNTNSLFFSLRYLIKTNPTVFGAFALRKMSMTSSLWITFDKLQFDWLK